jgi:phage-related protein
VPKTEIITYREADGSVPLLDWLDSLSQVAREKCLVKIELLAEFGHELRRPHCDLLEQGVWELRARAGHVHYRILYFFYGRKAIVLSHGFSKERYVPEIEIEKAMRRRESYTGNPSTHTYEGYT